MKRTKTLYRTLAITTAACLLCFTIALAKKPDKPPGGGGGGDETGPAYFMVDLLGFPGPNYQSSGTFITNQDTNGDVLIYGDARVPNAGSAIFHSALWHVDINGIFPDEDAEDRGIPAWSGGAEQTGINSFGVMVGRTSKAIEKDSGGNWVFPDYVDVPGLGYLELPSPLTRNTSAYGINDDGQIIGDYEDLDTNGDLAGYGALWQLNDDDSLSGPINLGLFYPKDINNWGVMTGRYLGYPSIAWFEGEGEDEMLVVEQLDSSQRFFGADAKALNDYPIDDVRLTVVGRYSRDENGDPTGRLSGFAWRPFDSTNPTTLLGTLGGLDTDPKDVNVHSEIVGWSDTKRSGQHAFIYKDGKMTDLNSMAEVGKDTLNWALGINDDSDIVGFMRIPKPVSERRGFLLRLIPIPSD